MQEVAFFAENSLVAEGAKVLLFNDAFNLYHSETNAFFKAYPIKGSRTEVQGSKLIIFLGRTGARIELPLADPRSAQIVKEIDEKNAAFLKRIFRHRAIPILILVAASIAVFYVALIALIPYLGNKLISREAEISIGRQLKSSTLAQERIAGATVDTAATNQLNAFASKLKLSDYPINITVLNSNTVNAYALPGGEIVLYSAMIKKIDSYEALVALLAHESSHINQRHTLRSLLKSAANNIAIAVVLGDIAGVTTVLAGGIQNLSQLQYSRSLETEADEEGMRLMNRNEIDANGMKRLMKVFEAENQATELPAFLNTHPLTRERIANAENYIESQHILWPHREDLAKLFGSIKSMDNK